MKIILSLAAVVSTVLMTATAFAGGGSSCHFHGSTTAKESVVLECGQKEIKSLVAKAKIEPT